MNNAKFVDYEIVVLDRAGYDLVRYSVGSIKEGKIRAKQLLADPEYTGELGKVEILDNMGICLLDFFP